MHLPQETEASSDIISLLPPDNSVQKALEFYDSELQSLLEPMKNGHHVAIHPDTKEYVVERGPGKAYRALRAKQPIGAIVIHHIGLADSGLKARLEGTWPQ